MEPAVNFKKPLFDIFISTNNFNSASIEQKLNALQLIFMRTIEALIAFKEQKFEQFDALVGEQACQIRALKVALLSMENFQTDLNFLEEKFEEIKAKITALQNEKMQTLNSIDRSKQDFIQICDDLIKEDPSQSIEIDQKRKIELKIQNDKIKSIREIFFVKSESLLKDILNENITINEDSSFLATAYILTITKVRNLTNTGYKNSTDAKLILTGGLNCGKSIFSETTLNAIKSTFSRESVNFVKQLDCSFSLTENINKNSKAELPFFYMNKVIFKIATEKNIPILLKIGDTAKRNFPCKIVFPVNADIKSAALIVEAFSRAPDLQSSEYKKKLESTGILQIMDYNAAQHGQYTDQENFDENQKSIKKEAIIKGYSLQNPFMCCVDHVFCDVLENQLGDKK